MSANNSNKITLHDLAPSLLAYFENMPTTGGSSSLVRHTEQHIAETEGQTEFTIKLATFDSAKDTVFVQSGRTILFPEADFSVNGKVLTLVEGLPQGRALGVYILKNVPLIDGEGYFDGSLLEEGSVPSTALEESIINTLNSVESLSTEMDEVKKSVSDGKELVANAITSKGVETATDATFETIASNISNIVTLDSAPGLEAATWTPGTSDQVIAAGNYLRGDQTIKGDANLVAANIAKGKSVFGVTGTYDPATSSTMKYVIVTVSSLVASATISSDPYLSNGYSGYDYKHHFSCSYTAPSPIIHIERSWYSSGYYNTIDTIIPGFGYLNTIGHSIYSCLVRGATKYLANGGFTYNVSSQSSYGLTFTLSSDFKTLSISAFYCSDSSNNLYSTCVGLGQMGSPSTSSSESILILY